MAYRSISVPDRTGSSDSYHLLPPARPWQPQQYQPQYPPLPQPLRDHQSASLPPRRDQHVRFADGDHPGYDDGRPQPPYYYPSPAALPYYSSPAAPPPPPPPLPHPLPISLPSSMPVMPYRYDPPSAAPGFPPDPPRRQRQRQRGSGSSSYGVYPERSRRPSRPPERLVRREGSEEEEWVPTWTRRDPADRRPVYADPESYERESERGSDRGRDDGGEDARLRYEREDARARYEREDARPRYEREDARPRYDREDATPRYEREVPVRRLVVEEMKEEEEDSDEDDDDDDDEDDDEDDDVDDVDDQMSDFDQEDVMRRLYDFSPSGLLGQSASGGLDGEGTSASMSSLGGGGGLGGGLGGAEAGAGVPRPLQVFQSEYTGDGFPAGSHSARLTAVLESRRTRKPLFRWRHVTQKDMNFEELSREVGRIDGLSDSDRHGLGKLLANVHKHLVRSTPTANGSSVNHVEPQFLPLTLDQDGKSKGRDTAAPRTATWLSIPYFSLQRYAGPLSEAAPGSFPTRTLLQGQYSGVTRDRDLQQVVCQTGHVPPGMCFHVAQLWCIVLDDSLLVTCGAMSEAAIREDVVDLVTEPSRDPASSAGSTAHAAVYVSYTDSVLYALPLDACPSWFAFVAHFHEYWPQTLRFTHRDRPVTAAEWPAVLNLARSPNAHVVLSLKVAPGPQPPPRGELKVPGQVMKKEQEEEKEKEEESETDKDEDEDTFHVFSWLDESSRTTANGSSPEQTRSLQTHLQEIHDFLDKETNAADRRAYRRCPEAARLDTFAYLEAQAAIVDKDKDKGVRKQSQELADRIDVFTAADIIFRFFLPLGFDGPTVGKFWGAVYRLVQMPKKPERSERHGEHDKGVLWTRTKLRKLTQAIQAFTNILSHAQPGERAAIAVPLPLVRAWAHLVMALVKANTRTDSHCIHLRLTAELVKDGMLEVMQALPGDDLLAKEVVQPMDLVWLLSLKLVQDSTGTFPNLDMTYSEYLNALDNEVATQPSERSFSHRINLLKQETAVILKTVAQQRGVFASLTADARLRRQQHQHQQTGPTGPIDRAAAATATSSYPYSGQRRGDDAYYGASATNYGVSATNYGVSAISYGVSAISYGGGGELGPDEWPQPPREYYRLSPTHPGGFRDLLAADCLGLIDRRFAAFQELFPYAEYLQKYNENKWEDTKDRQEQAIYAFTIVTVIFLPLSAVAGIFGMNTADVRDMEVTQWAYWAAAVPVTLLVIVVGLWWMGELGNALASAASILALGWRRDAGYADAGAGAGRGRFAGGRRRPREEEKVVVAPIAVHVGPEVEGYGKMRRRF